jgi:hypothetical protein
MDVTIPCICPESPHTEDTVTLRDTLTFRQGKRIQYEIALLDEDQRADIAFVLALLTESYILAGIEAWTLTDEKGKPVAVSEEAIRSRLLTHPAEADAIAEAADGLYQEAVMLPLLRRAQNSSPPTPTDDSTSAPKDSAPTPLKRSKRSSTTTSPMDGTAQISA